jgi:hypothetical protein
LTFSFLKQKSNLRQKLLSTNQNALPLEHRLRILITKGDTSCLPFRDMSIYQRLQWEANHQEAAEIQRSLGKSLGNSGNARRTGGDLETCGVWGTETRRLVKYTHWNQCLWLYVWQLSVVTTHLLLLLLLLLLLVVVVNVGCIGTFFE